MRLRHYILTRFNIPIWKADKNGAPTLNEQWLTKRFLLFDRFCFPSISAQTSDDFLWVVLFDRDTPPKWKDCLEQYKRRCPQFNPVFVRHDAGRYFLRVFCEVIAKDLAEWKKKGVSFDAVLTTYFDNDDALRTTFVEDIRHEAEKLPLDKPSFITYRRGLQYFTDMNIATRVKYVNNHFLSLLESLSDETKLTTVYGFGSHSSLSLFHHCHKHIIDLPDKPAWVEVVHDSNVMNDVLAHRMPGLVTDLDLIKRDFAIDITLSNHSRWLFATRYSRRLLRSNWNLLRLKWARLRGRKQ